MGVQPQGVEHGNKRKPEVGGPVVFSEYSKSKVPTSSSLLKVIDQRRFPIKYGQEILGSGTKTSQ